MARWQLLLDAQVLRVQSRELFHLRKKICWIDYSDQYLEFFRIYQPTSQIGLINHCTFYQIRVQSLSTPVTNSRTDSLLLLRLN